MIALAEEAFSTRVTIGVELEIIDGESVRREVEPVRGVSSVPVAATDKTYVVPSAPEPTITPEIMSSSLVSPLVSSPKPSDTPKGRAVVTCGVEFTSNREISLKETLLHDETHE